MVYPAENWGVDMKGVKLLCFSLLVAIGFAFAGESFIIYLTTFEFQCIYTEFYYNASPGGTKETMVSDIIKEAENNGIGVFAVVDESQSSLKSTRKIYAANGADSYIKDNYGINQSLYKSIFSGSYNVEFYSFDKLIDNGEDMASVTTFYIIGDMESARNFKVELVQYAGKFPKFGNEKNYDMYVLGIWGIIAAIILLLTYFEIQFNKKECYVCITLGTSVSRILLKSVLPDIITFVGVFFIEYTFLCKFTTAKFMFNKALIVLLVLIVSDFVFYSIGFSTFKIKKAFSGLSFTNKQLNFTYALKLGTLIITLCIISSNISQIDRVFKYYQLRDFFDVYSDYVFVNFSYDMDSDNPEEIYNQEETEYDFDSTVRDIEFYLKQNENSNATMISHFSDENVVTANTGAFEYLSGKIDKLSSLDMSRDFYILVSKSMNKNQADELVANAISSMNYIFSDDGKIDLKRTYEIIYYQENINVCAINTYDDGMSFCEGLENPVIIYLNDYSSVDEKIAVLKQQKWQGDFLVSSIESELKTPELVIFESDNALFKISEEELESFVSSHSDTHKLKYEITNAKEKYEYYKQAYDKLLILNGAASVLAMILQIIISFTIIKTEYSINAKELFIRKTLGYSTVENNKQLIMFSLIPLSLFIIISFALFIIIGMDIMIYYAIIGILLLAAEMLFITLFTFKMERISIHNMIKGGIL